ncbi:MAG: trigger factor [Spirochaetia bacterium]
MMRNKNLTINNKKIEYIAGSLATVSATIGASDVSAKYQEVLKKYQKQINLPGFRKGHTPIKMIEKRYGEGLKAELIADLLEEAIQEMSNELERKPLPYAHPHFDGPLEIDAQKDFSFEIKLEVEPEFTVADYKKMSTTIYDVKVSKKDVESEIERLRERNAIVVTKDGIAEKGNIITVDYAELDDAGRAVDGTQREGFVFTAGTDETYYDFEKEILGMKAGEEKEFKKKFAKAYRHEDLAGREVSLRAKVSTIKRRDLPELDDDFAQDIDEKFQTMAQLREDIQSKLDLNAVESARNHRINHLIKEIVEKTDIDIPAAMIRVESDMRIRQMAQQSGMDEKTLMKMLGGQKEQLYENMQAEMRESVKSRLVLQKLKEEMKLSVDDAEKAEAKKLLIAHYRTEEQVLVQQIGVQQWEMYVEEEAKERKLHQALIDGAKVKEQKTLSWDEFVAETTEKPKSGENEEKPKAKAKKAKTQASSEDGEKS